MKASKEWETNQVESSFFLKKRENCEIRKKEEDSSRGLLQGPMSDHRRAITRGGAKKSYQLL